MIRKLILTTGEKLIDIFVVLSLIAVFIGGIGVSSNTRSFGEGLLLFILFEIIGFIYVVIIFFFIYLALDIRSILKKIEENTSR